MSDETPTQNVPAQKYPALSQLIICTGGSCAGKDGGAHSPKKAMLDAWKKDYLWRVCHLSFSDCLGPCDGACNAALLTADGLTWLSGLEEQDFERFIVWVQESQQAGHLLPLPDELSSREYSRFAQAGTFPLTHTRRTV